MLWPNSNYCNWNSMFKECEKHVNSHTLSLFSLATKQISARKRTLQILINPLSSKFRSTIMRFGFLISIKNSHSHNQNLFIKDSLITSRYNIKTSNLSNFIKIIGHEDSSCHCGLNNQTSSHLLFQCPIFQNEKSSTLYLQNIHETIFNKLKFLQLEPFIKICFSLSLSLPLQIIFFFLL